METINARCESRHLKQHENIADEIGISKRTVYVEKQIATNVLPEVQQSIKTADLPKTDAIKIARLEPKEQLNVAEKLDNGYTSFADAIRVQTR